MEKRKIESPQFKTAPLPKNSAPINRPNFIVLLLESWSAKFLESHGYDSAVAPNFNRLAKQGVFFQNFYSAGGRSANGLFSILTGLPDRAGRTVLRSSQIFNRFGALPLLLKDKGYNTLFVHGGDLHFDNLDTGLPHLGFDKLVGLSQMEASGRYKQKWTMGFHDEDMYDMLLYQIDTVTNQPNHQPFFAMAFSSNNHHPFGLPNDSFKIFSEETDVEAAFKNSYHYADYCLGILVDRIKEKPYYENTIIVIVADHSHHANLDYLQDREIPMLVLAPSFFVPQTRKEVATQLDILPTILSLSGGDSYYSSMGRDLSNSWHQNHTPFAFFAGGSNTDIIGMIQDGFVGYHYLRSNQSVLLKGTHPTEMKDIKNDQNELFLQIDQNTKHYYQFARTLEQENRIWPETLPNSK
ncbi:MAG: LTA synthase family protein [Leptonema sp. (in: Bacteria)]|nr:LTA synthase family protein [Leptonema sp. (in: bacteria)]